MKKYTIILVLLLSVLSVFSQDKYKRIAINNPSKTIQQLISKKGLDLSCGAKHEHQKLIIEIPESEINTLNDLKINYTVLIEDLATFYSNRIDKTFTKAKNELQLEKLKSKASKTISQKSISGKVLDNFMEYVGCDEVDWVAPTNFNLGSMGGCLTVSEMEAELDQMRALYPNLISAKMDAGSGKTTWGNPANTITNNGLTYTGQGNGPASRWAPQTIYYTRITGDQSSAEGSKPQTLFTSMIHSREVGSLMSNIYFMWYLLENYNTNNAIKNLVDNNELYFIPVLNPDGLKWNEHLDTNNGFGNGGGLQRKNCRPNTGSTSNTTSTRGVDLNRNFDYFWGSAGSGSSVTPSSDSYRGPSPFSEPETQILRDFVQARDFKTCLMNHTSANSIPHPYGGNPSLISGREDEMHKWHEDMTRYNRYVSGATIFTPANGIADDWMVGGNADANGKTGSTKTILASTPEHGGTGFWPPTTDIVPIAKRAMRISLTTVYYGGQYAKLHDLTPSDISASTSNLEFAIERLGQTDSDFTLTITPISANISSITPVPTQTGMTILEQRNVSTQLVLNSSILPNDKIEYNVQLSNGSNVFYNVNFEKYYQPSVLLADNPDSDLLTNWITSGNWSASNASGVQYSGSRAIKIGGNTVTTYSNNATATLTSSSSYNLSGASEVIVQFFTKWDLERNYDFVEIQGSTNGNTWQSLCGKYTKPSATSTTNGHNAKGSNLAAFQSNNSSGLVYDGDRMDKWVMEEIVIDADNNSFLNNATNAQFRFRFRSDANNRFENYSANGEGFFIDDFKILSINTPCVLDVPSNIESNSITENQATVVWENIPSATYDLRYRIVGTQNWIDISGLSVPTATLTGLDNITDYEVEIRTNCGSNNSAYAVAVNFTTLDAQLNYCNSASTNANDEFISSVKLNTIDNSSDAQFYSDFTNISTTLLKDAQYNITITPTWPGTVYNEAYAVWIDYNRDGDFDDAGEQVYTQGNTQATSVSGNFTIPQSAVENSTRMRVSMKYNAIPTSCETFQFGEVEDYTVIIEGSGPDTTAPVITLNGAATIDLSLGDVYTEAGATATDDLDGDITAAIIIGGDVVDTNTAGTYVVTYDVTDAAGNSATQEVRTVNIIPDTTAPVITLNGAATLDLSIGYVYTEAGATATDDLDGDITAAIIIGGDVVDTNTAGTYVVTYDVTDAAGNPATQEVRTVNIIPDTTAPVITLNGAATIDLSLGDVYTEAGATATDNLDGDITAAIIIGGDVVDTNTAGTYVVTYDVTDAAGNPATQEVRTVNIIPDTTAPVITLNGAATLDLSLGDVYTEAGATATDDLDGDITAAIIIGGDVVDTNTAGTYVVTYDVTDAAGNSATQEVRTVNIIPDTTAPVITLNGAATLDLSLGDVYTEAGATATDDLDGDITAAIIIGGDVVDTNTAGTYVVTYNVNDASGNAASELVRTVTVSSVINGCSGGIASFPYAEGFENTLGGWVQSSSDDLDWLIDANGTPSNNTGPSSAIEGNSYIFVEASVNGTGFPNKRALLTSPCFDLSALTQATFSFNYHMFGATDMGTIALEISDDEGTTWTSIWSESGNKGNSWQTATINLSTYVGGGVQLRFNRFVGSTWQADIAIDAISLIDEEVIIESCLGEIANFPYIESYENTIGDWTQSTTDDINWTVDANGTPSNGTGPSSAIDGGSYIYVEASGNGDGFPNKQAIINSPCYDFTSVTTASFSFNYHMFGAADMGTLALEASNDNGISWTTLWSESGNKGNSWQSQIIDLSAYAGNSVQLRFNRVTGGTWEADIAIDNVNLTTSTGAAKDTIKNKFDAISNTLTLYPNPVKDVLNLKTLKRGILTYKIINSLGQIINEGKEGNRIIVDRLEAGMYFIEVTQGNDKMMKRFIKE